MAAPKRQVVEYRVYDLPLDFPAILLHGEQWHISDILSARLHFHNCFELGICHSEGGIMVFGEETLPFRAGDVICVPRHTLHTTCSDKGTRSKWSYLHLDLERLAGFDALPAPDRPWILSRKQHPRIHFLITSIFEEMIDKPADYTTVVTHLLALLYHELLRLQQAQHDTKTGKRKSAFKLKPAMDHIASHFMQPITVDELAGLCSLSTTHFRRLFTEVVGESPIGFLNTTRINQACALLLTTEDSILSIAGAVGFASISSFNRYFALVMGVSPREYRNPSIRGSIRPQRKYVVRYEGWMAAEARPATVAGQEEGNGLRRPRT